MREAYRDQLEAITSGLVVMARTSADAMKLATESLLRADLPSAERVIAADSHLDALRDDLDDQVVELLARQQPVARELRIVVAALRMADDIERMGDLALHIAKLTRLRYPAPLVPATLHADFTTMGAVAARLAFRMAAVIEHQDPAGAREMDRDDDEIDELRRKCFVTTADPDWPYGVETAIDIALASRYYERYADHAVKAARRVYYLVTGSRPVPPLLH